LNQEQRSYDKPKETSFVIIPTVIELGAESRTSYKTAMETIARTLLEEEPDEQIIAAMPICNESEQDITDYAKSDGQIVSLLPLTMFDINSFRRLQNVLYRQILKLDKFTCPNCGRTMRKHDNQLVCDNCNQLTLTRTICPNPKCRHEYLYMGYDVSEATLQKMQNVKKENYFQWDSLYQYKDIVNMSVASGK
jgi:ribosomal protein S27AE